MEQNLKQRLVGALVLISLAVIFLPLVFDGQQQRIDTAAYTIPEKPTLEITAPNIAPLEQEARNQFQAIAEVNEAKARQEDESSSFDHSAAAAQAVAAVETAPAQPPSTPTSPTPAQQYLEQEKKVDAALQDQPITTTAELAESWVIQVGAFSSDANANGLQEKLKASGYAAFVKTTKVSSGLLYKVYVGPEIRRAQLDQQKIALEQKFNLKALILKYIP